MSSPPSSYPRPSFRVLSLRHAYPSPRSPSPSPRSPSPSFRSPSPSPAFSLRGIPQNSGASGGRPAFAGQCFWRSHDARQLRVCVCVCARARAVYSGQVCDFYGGRPAGVGRATSGQCSGFRVGPWEAVTSLGIDHGHVPSLHRSRSRPFHRSRPRVDHGHVPSIDHGHVPRPLYPHTRLAQGKYISARGCGRLIRVSCTHVVLQYAY